MAQENSFTIKGTIYKKETQTIIGKKDPSQTYEKTLLTLEVKSGREVKEGDKTNYRTTTNLPQIEFFGINLDDYSQGDFVQVNFYLSGKEFTRKDGTKGIITKPAGTYIKFADLDAGYPSHKNKFGSDVEIAKIKEVFQAPDPNAVEEESDLPF